MGLMLLIIAACLLCGVAAVFAVRNPTIAPQLADTLAQAHKPDLKSFSPRRTLFLIGPHANHAACRMQRRLLKPALAALIRDEVSVVEVYGATTPRKNGELMKWLDPALLRHALDAGEGFFVIYVDAAGKTVFRKEAPMVGADILALAGIEGLSDRRISDRRSRGPIYREARPRAESDTDGGRDQSARGAKQSKAVLSKLRST